MGNGTIKIETKHIVTVKCGHETCEQSLEMTIFNDSNPESVQSKINKLIEKEQWVKDPDRGCLCRYCKRFSEKPTS